MPEAASVPLSNMSERSNPAEAVPRKVSAGLRKRSGKLLVPLVCRSEGACPPGVEAGAQSVRREQERERSSRREVRTQAAERTNAVNAAGLSVRRSGRRAGDRATEGSSRRSAEREGRSSIRAERAREGAKRPQRGTNGGCGEEERSERSRVERRTRCEAGPGCRAGGII